MTNQEIFETIKYMNFCGLCTTGNCKNCTRKIAKDKVLELLEKDTAKQPIEHTKQNSGIYEMPSLYHIHIHIHIHIHKGPRNDLKKLSL